MKVKKSFSDAKLYIFFDLRKTKATFRIKKKSKRVGFSHFCCLD